MLACFQEVVRLLIGAKANVEASRKGGFSPLYIACQCGSEAVVDLLLESGADANHANEAGLSPFTAACHGAPTRLQTQSRTQRSRASLGALRGGERSH